MAKAQRLVSRLELVRRTGRSKSALYRDCEKGGDLYPAMIGAGGRNPQVDLDHQAARVYLAKHGYQEPDATAISREAMRRVKKSLADTVAAYEAPPPAEEEIDAEEFDGISAADILNMTLSEIIHRYGRNAQFKDYVAAGKNLVSIRGMEDEQARKRGEYIHRSHAEKLVAMVDGLTSSLLTDSCTNIATTTTALVKSGADQRRIEESVRAVIGRTIQQTKSRIVQALRNV